MHFANPNGPVIVYTFDRHMAPYVVVSMASAQQHCAQSVTFYCLFPSQDAEALGVFEQLIARGLKITFVPLDLSAFEGWKVSHLLSPATYARLLIPSLINEKIILYLDPDTLIERDITPLFQIDLGDNLIGAVEDVNSKLHPVSRAISDTYVNSGVMLMNLTGFGVDCLDEFKRIRDEYHDELATHDQCLMNVFTDGRKLMLNSGWNKLIVGDMAIVKEWQSALADPQNRIFHYCASPKPWSQWAHPSIAAHYWNFVKEHALNGIPAVPITQSYHLEQLAKLHDLNSEFFEASAVKGTLIDMYKAHLAKPK